MMSRYQAGRDPSLLMTCGAATPAKSDGSKPTNPIFIWLYFRHNLSIHEDEPLYKARQ